MIRRQLIIRTGYIHPHWEATCDADDFAGFVGRAFTESEAVMDLYVQIEEHEAEQEEPT